MDLFGMMQHLEAVDRESGSRLRPATIARKNGPLLWIHFDDSADADYCHAFDHRSLKEFDKFFQDCCKQLDTGKLLTALGTTWSHVRAVFFNMIKADCIYS